MRKKIDTNDNHRIDDENRKRVKTKPKKRKGILRKIVLAILILILLGAIGMGIWFGSKVYKNGGGEFNVKGVLATIAGHDEQTLKKLPKIYFLATGQSQNLTDTIMVCSYDPKVQEASILSIPRDTFVGRSKYNANSYDKINSLYQLGPEKTLKAVNEITGLDIKYYINIDTEALREVVDSIGGVYFNVPIDMDYDDPAQDLSIHLKAGYQLLDGDKAEQAVRFRHNNDGTSYPTEYGDNDLGRMKTQRAFIEAVVKKMATPSTLTKLPDLIKVAEKNITTNIDFSKIKDYAPYAVEFKTENLKTNTLPGTPELINGMWFFTPNKIETKDIIMELFPDEEENEDINEINEDTDEKNTTNTVNTNKDTINKSNTVNANNNMTNSTKNSLNSEKNNIKIEILNGTLSTNKLNSIKNKLKENGYNVTKTGTTTNTNKTLIINRTSQSDTILNKIKGSLNNIGTITTGSNNSDVDITIIIGNDFE